MLLHENLTIPAVALIAVTLLFQPSSTLAGGNGKRDEHGQQANVTFTKWVTSYPNMAGVVGGDVGDGLFTGEVLMATPGPVTVIEALYHFHGPTHYFTALVHVDWKRWTRGSIPRRTVAGRGTAGDTTVSGVVAPFPGTHGGESRSRIRAAAGPIRHPVHLAILD